MINDGRPAAKAGEKKARRKEPSVRTLYVVYSLCVFIVLVATMAIITGVEVLLKHYGVTNAIFHDNDTAAIIVFAVISIPIGMLITLGVIRLPMRPVRKLVKGMTRLASGHFDERLHLGSSRSMREISDAFNTLADELQKTEVLRSDFVNNFSHEFKTPIVSINGFATILMGGGLTEEEQREYVGIIAAESARLAGMATNVLSLTHVENQTILSNVRTFNLSEQLRQCILLLEKEWSAKNIGMETVEEEIDCVGEQDLLKQAWVNLLHNAIKFSPEGGTITVSVSCVKKGLSVSFTNHGPAIPPEDQGRVFDKFWQGDTSHASEGTGVGLAVVKRVAELHDGRVSVDSDEARTVFTVELPQP